MNIDGLIFKLRDLSAVPVFSVLSAPTPCKIFLSDHTFGSDKFRQDAKYIPIYFVAPPMFPLGIGYRAQSQINLE